MTCAPSAAASRAVAAPMPEAAPVIMTTLSSRPQVSRLGKAPGAASVSSVMSANLPSQAISMQSPTSDVGLRINFVVGAAQRNAGRSMLPRTSRATDTSPVTVMSPASNASSRLVRPANRLAHAA
jgi:hypothetical protein